LSMHVDARSRIVVIEMGAGIAIPSVRHFSHVLSREYSARIIRINPHEPQVSDSRDICIACGSLTALQGIDTALERLVAAS